MCERLFVVGFICCMFSVVKSLFNFLLLKIHGQMFPVVGLCLLLCVVVCCCVLLCVCSYYKECLHCK